MIEVNCKKVGLYSIYFEGGFYPTFRELYGGVIVNASISNGEGHFSIRKPKPKKRFWKKTPEYVIWKNSREKMKELRFRDSDCTIECVAEINNPSEKILSFDDDVYYELKSIIPGFLKDVGYEFDKLERDDILILEIKKSEN